MKVEQTQDGTTTGTETVDQGGHQTQTQQPDNTWEGIDPDVVELIKSDPVEAAKFAQRMREKKSSANEEARQHRKQAEELQRKIDEMEADREKAKKRSKREKMEKEEALQDEINEYKSRLDELNSNSKALESEIALRDKKIMLMQSKVSSDPEIVEVVSGMLTSAQRKEGDDFDYDRWVESTKAKFPTFFTDGKVEPKKVEVDTGVPSGHKQKMPGDPSPEPPSIKTKPDYTDDDRKAYQQQREKYGLTKASWGY